MSDNVSALRALAKQFPVFSQSTASQSDPRARVMQGYCYPIVLGHTTAAALLLQLNLLVAAGQMDICTWRKLNVLLAIQEQAEPDHI